MRCGPRPPRHEHCPGQKNVAKSGQSAWRLTKATAGAAVLQYSPGKGAFLLRSGRRRAVKGGMIRISNINLKNIGSYAEGEGKEERHELKAKAGRNSIRRMSQKKGFNEELLRFGRFGR